MAPDPYAGPGAAAVLVGGGVAALVALGALGAEAVGDGVGVATADATAATCQTPPMSAIPSPLVSPAAVSWAK